MTMVTTSCDLQLRPGASPKSRGYVYTGPREVSSLVTDLPGTPVTPRLYKYIYREVLRLFRRYTHTHTHPASGRVVRVKNEMKMRMKGGWKWDDHEDEMKSYLRTRRGERKKRRREHQHDTPGPERANPEREREKEKRRVDGHGTRPAEGGEDESAWTNLTQRKPTNTSARDGANLPGEGRTHEIGDQWGLVDETTEIKTGFSS